MLSFSLHIISIHFAIYSCTHFGFHYSLSPGITHSGPLAGPPPPTVAVDARLDGRRFGEVRTLGLLGDLALVVPAADVPLPLPLTARRRTLGWGERTGVKGAKTCTHSHKDSHIV